MFIYKWKHIEFLNGSNPYICKTTEEFERIRKKYVLLEYKENFYIAIDKNERGKQKNTMIPTEYKKETV